MLDLNSMSKEELIKVAAAALNKNSGGNNDRVLAILKKDTWLSLQDVADKMNISKNNVSSSLTAIRKKGHIIIEHNFSSGKKIMLLPAEYARWLDIIA